MCLLALTCGGARVSQYLPDVTEAALGTAGSVVQVNLNQPMVDVRRQLSEYPIRFVPPGLSSPLLPVV